MVPPTAQCCLYSMTTMSVCGREACIAGYRSESSHESALAVADAGRVHQQCIMVMYNHRYDLMTSVKPADQHWTVKNNSNDGRL